MYSRSDSLFNCVLGVSKRICCVHSEQSSLSGKVLRRGYQRIAVHFQVVILDTIDNNRALLLLAPPSILPTCQAS